MVKPVPRHQDKSRFYVLLGGIAVVGVVLLGYCASQGGGSAPITIDPTTATGTVVVPA